MTEDKKTKKKAASKKATPKKSAKASAKKSASAKSTKKAKAKGEKKGKKNKGPVDNVLSRSKVKRYAGEHGARIGKQAIAHLNQLVMDQIKDAAAIAKDDKRETIKERDF